MTTRVTPTNIGRVYINNIDNTALIPSPVGADLTRLFTVDRCRNIIATAQDHANYTVATIRVWDYDGDRDYYYDALDNQLTIRNNDGDLLYDNHNGHIYRADN